VLKPFTELCLFFKQLCSKTLKVEILEEMEKNIAVTPLQVGAHIHSCILRCDGAPCYALSYRSKIG